jgi:hypothetical protein
MCVKNIVEAVPEIINIQTKNGLTPIYLGRRARCFLIIVIKFVQLDLVWSLAILNHLDPDVCQSVLNDEFIHDVLSKIAY